MSEAREFAIKAHGNQRYGEHPYVYHLDQVAELCRPYGEDAITVAYLHDVLEDTRLTRARLGWYFSPFIAGQVAMVTDPPGPNRSVRKLRLYAKIAKAGLAFDIARIVKVADRLANVRECLTNDPQRLAMYRAEHAAFRGAVFRAGLCDALWEELRLAFERVA